jgi:hypothetical protein
MIPITNLSLVNYNARYKNEWRKISFAHADIQKAIDNKEWEQRPFQSSLSELQVEWDLAGDLEASIELQKQYHVKRIATIIKEKLWQHPLLLYKDRKSILDGGHRLWAMNVLKRDKVEVIIINKSVLSESEKEILWKTIRQFGGDARRTLEYLRIEIIAGYANR